MPVPTISGTTAGQTTTQNTPIDPFTTAVITDAGGGTDTVTVTLTNLNGGLSGIGVAATATPGVYTVTGVDPATVNANLDAAVFTPTGAPNTGVTTGFGLVVVDTINGTSATDSTTTVTDTVAAVAPTISGVTIPVQTTASETPVHPFSTVTVGDTNASATDTLTITPSVDANGALSGIGLAGGALGVYTLTGTAAAITTELDALTFTPNAGAPNSSATTTFALSDASSAFLTPAINGATTVTNSDPAVAPTISGTIAGQRTTGGVAIDPFSGVTIADPNAGATETLTVSLSNLGLTGSLSGLGAATFGVYTLTAMSPSAINAALDASVFTPTSLGLLPGSVTPTTFTLHDVSSAIGTPSATDANTTVTNTAPTDSILFQNFDGQASLWQLNGTNIIGGGVAGPNPGTDWTAVGTADLFGADPADILWQNTSTGALSIWDMNGTNLTGGGPVGAAASPTVALMPGPDWKAVGTGAVGGLPEILLQNTSTGRASIWDLNATGAVTGGGPVSTNAAPPVPLNAGPDWRAVGMDNFNGDATSDILWQNSSTGQVSVWDMGGPNGNNVIGGGPVATPGADWKAVGTGTINGDTAIVLQNSMTSAVSIWEMGGPNGTSIIGGGPVATPGIGWEVTGTNGGSDILLQNTSFGLNGVSGQTSVWDMGGAEGTTIIGGGPTSANFGTLLKAVGLTGSSVT